MSSRAAMKLLLHLLVASLCAAYATISCTAETQDVIKEGFRKQAESAKKTFERAGIYGQKYKSVTREQLPQAIKKHYSPFFPERVKNVLAVGNEPWQCGCIVDGTPKQKMVLAGRARDLYVICYITGNYAIMYHSDIFRVSSAEISDHQRVDYYLPEFVKADIKSIASAHLKKDSISSRRSSKPASKSFKRDLPKVSGMNEKDKQLIPAASYAAGYGYYSVGGASGDPVKDFLDGKSNSIICDPPLRRRLK